MLVLSRKPGEQIVLGNNIRVTVIGIDGNNVRLGLTAPVAVPIRRAELAPPPQEPDDVVAPTLAASPRV